LAKILLVEDDIELAEVMKRWLTRENYTAELVSEGPEALSRMKNYHYDLIILDWQLPGMEGIDVLKQFRSAGGMTPVLMLTGKREIEDRVEGLDGGADDYLTKPFNGRELTARIRVLLRRPVEIKQDVLSFEELRLDPRSGVVTMKGATVSLRPKELLLLEFLMRNQGRLFQPQQLLDQVWPNESDATTEALRSCLKRLRNSLDGDSDTSIIRNVHGRGYGIGFPDSPT
jgi:DNA-binding response OmpR family regulator